MWKMDPMSGFDIRLVFTLPPRDSILQYKRCVHFSNNFPCITSLVLCNKCSLVRSQLALLSFNEQSTAFQKLIVWFTMIPFKPCVIAKMIKLYFFDIFCVKIISALCSTDKEGNWENYHLFKYRIDNHPIDDLRVLLLIEHVKLLIEEYLKLCRECILIVTIILSGSSNIHFFYILFCARKFLFSQFLDSFILKINFCFKQNYVFLYR